MPISVSRPSLASQFCLPTSTMEMIGLHAPSTNKVAQQAPSSRCLSRGDSEAKKAEKQAAWEAQQEVIRRRRDNSWQAGVKARRADVKRYNTDADYKKSNSAEQEVDERNRKKFLAEQAENPPPFGIIIPLAPFGMPAYDGGERFDLRAGHVDNGWVEEGATNSLGDFGKAIGNFFGGGKKKKKDAGEEEEEGKKKGTRGKR